MRIASKIYLAFFFISIAIDCTAQQYNFRNYNVPDGLAHSHVSKIFQDSKGYLWFSTLGGGISKFDGKNFINYTEKEGLSSNLIRCAIQAKNGDYWFGTSGGGLSKFDGEKFERIVDSTSNISDIIYSLMEDKEGAIWFTTNDGIYKYSNKKFTSVNSEFALPPKSANGLFMDSKNRIWFSIWDMGVYCIENKKITNYTEKDGLTSPCYTISEDKVGNIWLGLKKGVVKAVTKNSTLRFVPFDNDYLYEGGMVYSILADNKGNMWFGTVNSGLVKYSIRENKFVQISMKNGLPASSITALIEDREGNIWMACLGYGVVKYSGAAFVHYNAKDGLLMDYAGTIVQDKNKDLLINSAYSISRLKQNDTIVPFEENFEGKIHTIYKSKKGVLWVAGENGLFSYEAGKKKQYTKKDGLNAFPPTTLTEDKKGNIWCSSVFGWVSYFDGNKFVNFDKENGLKGDYIYSIYADSKDNIWVGNWATGLCKLDANGNKFNYFTKKDGLPSNNIMTVTEDEKGKLWLGTFGGGISVYDGKNFKTISTRDGLSDDVILGLIFDKNKDLWVSATKGINRLDMKEYDTSGKTQFRVYGKSEGFSNIECILNATLKDSENNLWFGTKGGLTKYNAAEDHINRLETQTYITDIKLFFEDANWSALCDTIDANTDLPLELSLNYKNNHLTFNFIGICTTSPEKVRYRYMLEGTDKGWSPASDKTSVTYSGLAPGHYVFKVMACNNEGLYNANPTVFAFVIEPPFWRRNWFYALCIISLIGCVYTYVQFQTKKLAKENKILEQKVEERTAEVVKKKDELEFAYHEIEEKNRDIMDSINYAKRIQYTLLANVEMIKANVREHFILFQPKDVVSGDFYWAAKRDDKFYLAVCDSTGHGVPGAFMSLLNISFLNEAITQQNIEAPNEILNYVRSQLINSISKDGAQDGMDGILLCIDKSNKTITYAAAHNNPVLISGGNIVEFKADKMPIGKGEKDASFTLFTIEMTDISDTLYLYTDGYADQFGGSNGKKFKYKQLQQMLLANCDKALNEQQEIFLNTFNEWKGNLEQVDDVLLIGIRV